MLSLALITLALGVLVGPRVVGGGWPTSGQPAGGRITLAAVPSDAPELGLVYEDLAAARADSPCAGAYQLDTPETCTHGPELAPAGLSVARDVAPVTGPAPEPVLPEREDADVPRDADVVADIGGLAADDERPALVPDAAPAASDFVLGEHGVACAADGNAGKRVQLLYLHEFGTASRFSEYLGSFRAWAAEVDQIFDVSAGETGGSRHVRYVTTPGCEVDVVEVQLPKNTLGTFEKSIKALRKLGYNRTDRKYLLFADANRYCGIATFLNDRRAGAGNRNNGGPSYARLDAGCWGALMATHQLAHTLGAVLPEAPNASRGGHCTDDYDVMCWQDSTETTLRVVCGDREQERRLDCNNDDYFHSDPAPGSFLAEHWNVADSQFLLSGDGGQPDAAQPEQPIPSAPAPTEPDSSAPADGERSGAPEATELSPSGSAAPSTPAEESLPESAEPSAPPQDVVLEFRDATSTSVRLVWTPAAPGTRYVVAVDGEPVATTTAAGGRLVGLRPDNRYEVQVLVAGDPPREHTQPTVARTAPAARPADNAWVVLTNSLTGGAADLYAARSANNAPIVLNRAEGGVQQQWKLTPVRDGVFQLRSRASGKCVEPQDGNPAAGVPLVQAQCDGDNTAQHWRVRRTDHGFSLGTTVGDLVVGAGAQRFGGPRVLVLQESDQSRHQSWTALPD